MLIGQKVVDGGEGGRDLLDLRRHRIGARAKRAIGIGVAHPEEGGGAGPLGQGDAVDRELRQTAPLPLQPQLVRQPWDRLAGDDAPCGTNQPGQGEAVAPSPGAAIESKVAGPQQGPGEAGDDLLIGIAVAEQRRDARGKLIHAQEHLVRSGQRRSPGALPVAR
jgi:hypothetical protein